MNKVFKVIWSEARNAYVVVSEIAKNHGSKSCSTKKLLAMLIATGVMTCASVAPVMAANLAPDDYRIEAGNGASASGQGSVAIGNNAQASGLVGIAIGRDAEASGSDSIAIGGKTKANQIYSVAIGNDISYIGYSSTAVGQQAYATGDVSTAIGTMTNVDADYNATHDDWRKAGYQSTAIGAYSGSWGIASTALGGYSRADEKFATAVGYGSHATAERATTLGAKAEANAYESVAIGAFSVADRESGAVGAFAPEGADSLTWKANRGAVSVGSSVEGKEITRQITNVAAGSADTDAVNVAQLNAVKAAAGKKVSLVDGENTKATLVKDDATGTQYKVDVDLSKYAKTEDVTESIYHMNGRISDLDNRVNKVGAGAAALAALHPLDFDPDAKWDFAAGYGNYRGANAAAVGAYYRPNEDTMFSVGGTFGNGENMVNAGVSFKLGSGSSHVSTSRVAMAKEIKELRGELEAMKSAMLDANAGKKIDTSKLQLFPDVPQNHWAYEYVAQLAGNGMIEGYPDGNFAGDRPMTRYEFAAILYRAMTKGAVLSDKILSEFSHELEYFTVDTIAKDKAGNPTIQRVRTVKENKNK